MPPPLLNLNFTRQLVRWLLLAGVTGCLSPARLLADEFDFFERKIRPVLIERCYKCHSAESEKLKGGLLLDSRAGILKGGESGQPAIVPGQAERSRLIEAIRYLNDDLQMPPKKKLSAEQIADFVAWVNSGAPDPRTNPISDLRSGVSELKSQTAKAVEHWAFQLPKDQPIPPVRNPRWPQTPIDNFILTKLEARGIGPSPRADKRTLIRRATYDLIGLPPTVNEIADFLGDNSRDAFARVVARLLASPHYGERWGRYWLDVARYADTKGYVYSDREEGRFVHSHVYRDWVIRAFNDDLPYDQFLVQQIAADQLPDSSNPRFASLQPQFAAMGFLTLGRRFLGVVHDIIDDRIDVVMRGTQGLSVGCARCHDHKFDPIPTRDYYSLYGVFNGCTEKMLALNPSNATNAIASEFEKSFRERVEKYNQTMQKRREEFSNRFRAKVADYLVAALDTRKLPSEEFYEIRGPDDLNPTVVRAWEAWLLQTTNSFHPVFAPWNALRELAEKEFASRAPDILARFSAPNANSENVNPAVIKALTEKPVASLRDVAGRYGQLLANAHQQWQTNVQLALTNKTDLPVTLPDAAQEQLRQVLYSINSPATVPVLAVADLEWYFDEGARVELFKLFSEIERWIVKVGSSPPFAVTLEDRPTQKNPRVFLRGNPANKGDEVPRQFLEIVAGKARQPFQRGSGRLEMAEAIASKDNPLTARVMVNRIWLHHFGAGLVTTPSDFGTRCEPPSHPELLDWLAQRFIDDGWSIKKLHRLILLSSVYQQVSDATTNAGALQIDPENRLLWRMNRQRLDFEAMRDSLLAAAGRLDNTLGGKPTDLTTKPFSTRRTVYGFLDRQFLPGLLRVFDFANPDMHAPQRFTTTVPQQALYFMNSPFVVEQARVLAARSAPAATQQSEQRLRRLYQLAFQHEPAPRQLEAGLHFVNSALAEPTLEPTKPIVSAWEYGWGAFDEAAQHITNFQALPHFTGTAWQGGANWPDEKLGWVQLTADGGHAGNDLQHAAIRRWIAPLDGVVTIAGTINHEHKEGDGIRARVVSSRAGQLGSWTLHNQKQETKFEAIEMKTGDTLDFVVDFNANLNNDDFTWTPTIKLKSGTAAASSSNYPTEWNAKKEFTGPPEPPPAPLNAWEKLAQVLLLSNEFMFVD
ncbi:MAG: PSD1 domain-containing protein [Verrucomicrobia bacterium]|nr:PSD1 domain-containing protein [Verrucomicrobiota bacterium]